MCCGNVRVFSCVYFFFFKQKTAYEMRISDWSSDVCSSDLRLRGTRVELWSRIYHPLALRPAADGDRPRGGGQGGERIGGRAAAGHRHGRLSHLAARAPEPDRKSTRLNSSH